VTLVPQATGGPPVRGGLERTPPWLFRLAFWSAASALASVVPVPFLDDHLVRVTRRRMVRELAREHGIALRETEVRLLAGQRPPWPTGCALFVMLYVKTAIWLLRRLFRTVFFWLTLQDVSNAASFTFHEGFLLRRALRDFEPQHLAPAGAAGEPPPRPEIERVRACIERVVREVDPRPLTQAFRGAFRGSLRVTRSAARRVRRMLLGRREEEAAARALEDLVPPTLVEGLLRALASQNPYLDDLAARMARVLAEPRSAPAAAAPAGTTHSTPSATQPPGDPIGSDRR
jgi:hypothetical protein